MPPIVLKYHYFSATSRQLANNHLGISMKLSLFIAILLMTSFEAIGDKVYFAGEAFSNYAPATVHGAGPSGKEAAESIMKI